jgi:hypothetical protein
MNGSKRKTRPRDNDTERLGLESNSEDEDMELLAKVMKDKIKTSSRGGTHAQT